MKEGWTYKKLGEVGTIIGGSTPKTDNPEFWDGDYSWITPAELDGSKYVSSTVRTITEKAVAKTNLTLLPIGTVLLSSRAPIGKVCITKIPMYCNQGFKNIVCSDELNNEYLYWWLKGKNEYLNSLGVGATFKEISKRIVEQIPIPLPPLETQSRIVSELDLLQSIIDKQKAQLAELDNLAQCIFYDMFGDPVENDKGWDVKKLGEVCTFLQGEQVPIEEQFFEKKDGTIRFLRIVDFTQGNEEPRYVYCKDERHILHDNEIAIVRYGTPGFVCYGKFGLIANNLFKVIPKNINFFDFRYLVSWLESSAFQSTVQDNQYGAALQAIKFGTIQNIIIIMPPLSLQQSFAAKIESIEKQKATISKSIEETQKLFNFTMDKYFG